MSNVLDYLKDETQHARIWLSEKARAVENQAADFLKADLYRTEEYRNLIKGLVRFQWIDYLGAIKLGKLDRAELLAGTQAFEVLYKP